MTDYIRVAIGDTSSGTVLDFQGAKESFRPILCKFYFVGVITQPDIIIIKHAKENGLSLDSIGANADGDCFATLFFPKSLEDSRSSLMDFFNQHYRKILLTEELSRDLMCVTFDLEHYYTSETTRNDLALELESFIKYFDEKLGRQQRG